MITDLQNMNDVNHAAIPEAVEQRRQDPEDRTSPSFHTQLNRRGGHL